MTVSDTPRDIAVAFPGTGPVAFPGSGSAGSRSVTPKSRPAPPAYVEVSLGDTDDLPVATPAPVQAPVARNRGLSHAPEGEDGAPSRSISACTGILLFSLLVCYVAIPLPTKSYWLFLFYVVAYLPSFCLLVWWWGHRDVASLDKTIRKYFLGFSLSIPSMLIALFFFTILISFARTLSAFIIIMVFFSFVFVALPEEYLKYSLTNKNFSSPAHRAKADLIYATAIALGFATGQCLFLLTLTGLQEIAQQYPVIMFRLTFELIMFFVPLHCLTGYQIGLRITIRDYYLQHPSPNQPRYSSSIKGILFYPVLLRGFSILVFAFCELLSATYGWTYGWVGGVVGNVLFCLLCIIGTKRVERQLPADYLRRVGYLHMMGYGVLPDDDGAREVQSAPEAVMMVPGPVRVHEV